MKYYNNKTKKRSFRKSRKRTHQKNKIENESLRKAFESVYGGKKFEKYISLRFFNYNQNNG